MRNRPNLINLILFQKGGDLFVLFETGIPAVAAMKKAEGAKRMLQSGIHSPNSLFVPGKPRETLVHPDFPKFPAAS